MGTDKYNIIGEINKEHEIYLVNDTESHTYYVRKNLTVYNSAVYNTLKTVNIPNIPKIIDIQNENGKLILIEEYIPGQNLQQIIDSGHKFTRSDIISILKKLSDILRNLHGLKTPIVHRDIKPSNVILTPEKEVYLIDFNAGKFWNKNEEKDEDTQLIGTHGYAAPEQYGFGESTPKTDIYALGILIEKLLATNEQNNKEVDLRNIAKRCTELRPEDRYNTIKEFSNALKKTTRPYFKYAPPGFRTLTIWKILIAIPYYLFAAFLTLCLEVENGDLKTTILYKVIFALASLSIVICSTNYLGIHSYFPLCRSKNLFLKTLGILLLNGSVLFLIIFIWIVLYQIIS